MSQQEPNQSELNPFASPAASTSSIPSFNPDTEIREFNVGKSLAKWLLVCFVSGAPSFYFGSMLGRYYAIQSAAMAVGILTFVALYVYVESRESTRRMLMDRSLRIAVRVGYITRVAISILFPVAMFPDMFCGIMSVGFTSALFGDGFGPQSQYDYDNPRELSAVFIFAWFYVTTLVQGVLLNIVLGAYTLIVFAFALLFRKRPTEYDPLAPR